MSTLSKRRHTYNTPGDLHELTWSCYKRQPLLKSDRAKAWLGDAIEKHRGVFRFEVTAFVFMPEHVHLLIRPMLEHYDISRIRAAIKKTVTKKAVAHLKESNPSGLIRLEAAPGIYRFWQDGPGYDRNKFSDSEITDSIAYLHSNPVRRGLCETILDYEGSSARAYYDLPSMIPVDIWSRWRP